jgi:hypothetical protein
MSTPIDKLEAIPSGRRVREVVPEHTDRLDWKVGADATKLMVTKINELIAAVNHIQQALDALDGATVVSESRLVEPSAIPTAPMPGSPAVEPSSIPTTLNRKP